jgi:hypothetical protein
MGMVSVVRSIREPLSTTNGGLYSVRICGRQRVDGRWEGWVEFESVDGAVLRTPRETTQPKLSDLEYWAGGLAPVYLEGALNRAIAAERAVTEPPMEFEPEIEETPAYDGPAAAVSSRLEASAPTGEAVMDPFSVYRKGEDPLRRQLGALDARHLRGIIRAYALASTDDVDIELLNEAALIELIVAGVKARLAA